MPGCFRRLHRVRLCRCLLYTSYAKAYSGVSLDSFIRKITFQEINGEGIQNIGPAIEVMAANEQLGAH